MPFLPSILIGESALETSAQIPKAFNQHGIAEKTKDYLLINVSV